MLGGAEGSSCTTSAKIGPSLSIQEYLSGRIGAAIVEFLLQRRGRLNECFGNRRRVDSLFRGSASGARVCSNLGSALVRVTRLKCELHDLCLGGYCRVALVCIRSDDGLE